MRELLIPLLFLIPVQAVEQKVSSDECARLSTMNVYSNATYVEEAGDVVGFDFAIEPTGKHQINAVLFVYEGSAFVEGVPLQGTFSESRLVLSGEWVEDLVEYPSHKTIHQSRHIIFKGKLTDSRLEGRLNIDDYMNDEPIRLVRSPRVWLCKGTK